MTLLDNIVGIGGGSEPAEVSWATCSDNHSLALVCGNGTVASGSRGVKFASTVSSVSAEAAEVPPRRPKGETGLW
jgi:hypothetical protein